MTLSPGDIGFVQYNADGTDNFAFVALVNIPAGEIINFTDNGFTGTALNTNEGTLTWTAPPGGVTAGTIVTLTTTPSATTGTVTEVGDLNFAASGDQILAYQGTSTSPTFIAALNNEGAGVFQTDAVSVSTNETALPTGLVLGTSAVALNEIDNALYSGVTTGTQAVLRSALFNNANFNGDDIANQTFGGTFTISGSGGGQPPVPPVTPVASNPNLLRQIGVFGSANGAEIPAFDPGSDRLFTVAGNVIEIIDLANPTTPTLIGVLNFTGASAAGFAFAPNSVAVKNGIVAVALAEVGPLNNQNLGRVQFFNASTGQFLNSVTVGFLPDALTFMPDGRRVVVANEGEPNEGFTVDPEGSISIINISDGVTNATVQTATFTSFNSQQAALEGIGVRIFGRIDTNNDGVADTDSTVAQDVEPEFIAFSGDGTKAFVTLQENNAFAVVDIATATVERIVPLGTKDFSLPGNGLDVSDRDVDGTSGGGGRINIQNQPIFGIFQPDAIASFTVGSQTFYITANEGDGRGVEEFRLGNLIDRGLLDVDNNGVADTNMTLLPSASQTLGVLRLDQNLGRITFTNASGDTDGDGLIEQLTVFGTRSFTIFDSNGARVFDSGDDLELITAAALPSNFNSNNDSNNLDNRSDNKGPEPEGVVTATIDGQVFAFIGLERVGGVVVYNVTNPQAPTFVQYFNNRNFTIDPRTNGTNSGPEGLTFISAADSPNGVPLVVVANEVSRTVQILQIGDGVTPIGEVQGTGLTSPRVGQTVTIEGIVTGDFQDGDGDNRNLGGFFVQALTPDLNPLTSDGIFVFDDRATNNVTTSPTVNVNIGDRVTVTGQVRENFSQTEINATVTGAAVRVVSSNNFLPAPVAIDLPSTGTVIANDFINQNDNDGIVELADSVANLERFEGLRVTFADPLFVTEFFNLDRFGEIRLIEGDRAFQFTNSNAPSTTAFPQFLQDIAARSVFLDDGSTVQNPNPIIFPNVNGITTANAEDIRLDTQVTNLVGNLNFAFGQYRLQPTQAPIFANIENRRPEVPDVGGELKVANFNVLNFFTNLTDRSDSAPANPLTVSTGSSDTTSRGATNQAEFSRQLQKLITVLEDINADVYSFIEVENNGFGAGSAIQTIVTALNAATGKTYAFVRPDDSELTSTSVGLRLGDDAITNAIIYDMAKVAIAPGTRSVVLTDREIAQFPGNPFPELSNLGADGVDPDLDDRIFDGISSGRNPLAATFLQNSNGAQFTLVSNHYKSKSQSGLNDTTSPNFDQNNGSGFWDDARNRSSEAILEWLKLNPTGSADPDVLILGDLNAYPRERPIVTLENGGFDNLIFDFFANSSSTQAQPYSFVFDGQAGVLDYAFSSSSLRSQVTGTEEWRINSDEADAIDYNTDFGRPAGIFDGTVPFRSSDHDPVLVGLNLTGAVSSNTVTVINVGSGTQLTGSDNSEQIFGTPGRDTIVAFGGDDFINSGAGNDSIDGGLGNDFIFGGDGNDTILGNIGNDTIIGGVGVDAIVTGSGRDVVRFVNLNEAGDNISDFADTFDRLEVMRAIASSFGTGRGQLNAVQQGSSTTVYIENGTSGFQSGETILATLASFPARNFTAADVIFS